MPGAPPSAEPVAESATAATRAPSGVLPPAALGPLGRLAGVVGAALLGFFASPGVSGPDGSLVLAVVGVALWSWTASRPLGDRPWRGRVAEWFGGSLAGGLMMWWVAYVVGYGAAYIGAGWGVYFVLMGALLRRLARRFPLPWAAALSWTGVELVRSLVPPPLGLGWFRLGYYAHAHTWLSGAARVVGVEGLTLALAALGGLLAALVRERRLRLPVALAGLAPTLVALVCAWIVPAPRTVDGPRVLLVQPGFTQRRKQFDDPIANLTSSRDLTHRALREVGPVDLVCWGESMLYCQLFTRAAEEALASGSASVPPWGDPLSAEDVRSWKGAEREWVTRQIMALGVPDGPFPAGASFSVGAEFIDLVGGELRRRVALVLYAADGEREPPAFKRFLVPLGETFFGFERYAWARRLAMEGAGYVPDLVPGERTGIFELRSRSGVQVWRASGSVCFDNAHPWPYLDALREGPVDFHLVASNEAWYETSCEMDQMVAFSRTYALMTGRAFVRATNSGVSLVLAPDGRELGRVRDASGRDRAVAGWGAWTVPVPAPGSAPRTPYVAWSRVSEGLWIGLLALAAFLAGRTGYPGARAG